MTAGGFPPALARARPTDRARWFDDYVELVIERDVLELMRVRQRRQLPLLLAQLASQTAQMLNIARAAEAIGMDKSTAESYSKLLETVFLVQRLPAWGTTLGSRVAATPKTHMVDSGLAARLLRLTESKLAAATAPALTEFGHLLETFVVGEVCRQLDWLDAPVQRGRRLRARLASQFLGGVVLYTGSRAYTHEGMQVLPISRLWRSGRATVEHR